MGADLGSENVHLDTSLVGQSSGMDPNAENDDGLDEDVLNDPEFIESDPE